MKSNFFTLIAGAAISVAGASTPVWAAEVDQSDRRVIETIVVTATYRETNLMDTAQSINAIDASLIEEMGAQDIGDLFQQIPGLNMTGSTAGNNRFSVRGVSSQVTDPTPQTLTLSTIGMYLDNTPVSSALGAARQISGNLFDVERVEVLKGPQGTLFGEGSQSGTIRFLFNQPQADELEFKLGLGAGQVSDSDDYSHRLDAMVNVPLVEDVLALRVVYFDTETAGYVDRVSPAQKDVNADGSKGGRFSLKYMPTDALSFTGTAYLADTSSDGNSGVNAPFTVNLPIYPGFPPGSDDKVSVYNFLAEAALGSSELTYSFSYFDRESTTVTAQADATTQNLSFIAALFTWQAAGLPFPPPIPLDMGNSSASVTDFATDVERYIHEVRLVSDASKRLRWTAGLFYKDSTDDISSGTFFLPAPGREAFEDAINTFFLSPANIHTDTLTEFAAYGEFSFDITDRLEVTAGVRISQLEQEIGNVNTKTKDRPIAPKIVLAWRPTDDLLTYFSYATGFRPGNSNHAMKFYFDQATAIRDAALANGNAAQAALAESERARAQANLSYDGDEVASYELGLKTTFWQGRAQISGAVYFQDWKDMIQKYQDMPFAFGGGFGPNRNAGSATARGIELELTALLTNNLSLRLVGDVNKAELEETTSAGLKGNDLVFAPSHSFAAMLDYSFQLTDRVSGAFHIDQAWVAKQFSDSNNSEALRLPSSKRTNARLSIRDVANVRWQAALYVKNLTNEQTLRQIQRNPFDPAANMFFYDTPRQVGVEFIWTM